MLRAHRLQLRILLQIDPLNSAPSTPSQGQSEAGVEAVAQIHSRLEGAESRLQAAVLASKTANG